MLIGYPQGDHSERPMDIDNRVQGARRRNGRRGGRRNVKAFGVETKRARAIAFAEAVLRIVHCHANERADQDAKAQCALQRVPTPLAVLAVQTNHGLAGRYRNSL